MGDKLSYLQQGVELLEKTEGCRVMKVSDFISTAPYGYLAVSYTHLDVYKRQPIWRNGITEAC